MSLKNNVLKSQVGSFLGNSQIRNEQEFIVEDYFYHHYPLKIIKRIIFKPYLKQWYPYLDIVSPGYESQLTLFYGKYSLKLSSEKRCSLCLKLLNNSLNTNYILPISLCSDCLSKVHFRYWFCLRNIYNNGVKNSLEYSSNIDFKICGNLFKAQCGFPINSEKINPCLKNHAIAIILKDFDTIEIIIGSLESIKYQIIACGGLLSVILGNRNRIMNLEKLELVFNDITFIIDNFIRDYEGEKFKFIYGKFQFETSKNSKFIKTCLLISFLRYYKCYTIKKIFQNLFAEAIIFLKHLITHIFYEIKYDIEILDFIELYKLFPPLSSGLRSYIEEFLIGFFESQKISSVLDKILEDTLHNIEIEKYFEDIKLVNGYKDSINNYYNRKEINMEEVLYSCGSYLFIREVQKKKIRVISIQEIIGRNII